MSMPPAEAPPLTVEYERLIQFMAAELVDTTMKEYPETNASEAAIVAKIENLLEGQDLTRRLVGAVRYRLGLV
jgi:hypothetical protein